MSYIELEGETDFVSPRLRWLFNHRRSLEEVEIAQSPAAATAMEQQQPATEEKA